MVVQTLLLAGGMNAVTGIAFAFVARGIRRRRPPNDGHGAHAAWVAWWAALGAYLLIQGALTIAASFGALDPTFYLITRVAQVPLLCLSAWGLTYYLVYLYTGDARWGRRLGVGFALIAALFYYGTFAPPTPSLSNEAWILELEGVAERPAIRLVYALVGLPPIAASLAYLALVRRATSTEQRYRIVLTSGSIFAYLAGGLAAFLGTSDLLKFVALVVLGLVAAGASLAAHYPPRLVRARFE